MEIVLRSQGYDLMYHHMSGDDLGALMEGKTLKELFSRGLKLTRSMVMLGGNQFSWRPNDIGLLLGVGLSTPAFARHQLSYGNVNQANKIGRSIQADLDMNFQVKSGELNLREYTSLLCEFFIAICIHFNRWPLI